MRFSKIIFTILLIISGYFCFAGKVYAATEFVSIVDTGGASDADYSTLSSWESAIGTNLTAPNTFVFSGSVSGTAPSDGAQVTLYRSGASTGVGATVVHTAKAANQIMLKGVGNTSPAYYQASDEWRIDASNLFLLSGTAPDQPQVTAKCRATTGTADTTAVTINGWDTDSTHYIKIWTDPSENYRHQGKYDILKYRLEVSSSRSIDNYEYYVRLDGLQIKNLYTSSFYSILSRHETGGDFQVSNSIFNSNGATGKGDGISADYGGNVKIWNNILYGFLGQGIDIYSGYAYNNTVLNSNAGVVSSDGTGTLAVIKNNLSYNNTDNYSGAFAASSTNNLTSGTDPQIPATNKRENVTVTFADSANNDFHLDSADTGAKNQGTILYDSGDDANLNFTTDADNEARKDSAGTWDIGADENVAKIYRSVGAGATSPLAWGGTADSSYGNMTISGLIATFWRPLPDNVGVGDALQYDTDNTGGIDKIVFITKRIDSTHYSVRKSDGTAPDATTSLPNSGWGIYRAYISLSNAEAGTENTGIADAVESFDAGNLDLTTNNLQWNIACYANGTVADTTAVTVSGWTTTADNYIRIYTPTRTDEVGTTQRHAGKWDTSKYYVSVTDSNAFNIQADYAWLDGVQITETSPTSSHILLWTSNITAGSNNVRISNNIFKGHNSGTYGEYGLDINDPDIIARVWNNIIYDIPDLGGSNRGISFSGAVGYIYSNTVIGPNQGIRVTAGDVTAKNNLIQTTSSAYLLTGGTWNSASSYNLADDATAPGSNPQNTKTVSFADSTNKDFHLAPGDSVARNIGTDLTNDLYLPINSDIDSTDPGGRDAKFCVSTDESCLTRPRATSWDIGADELITKIYRSVGVGTTAAIISGTSPAISLTISGNTGTFATWPTSADFGVGDVIRYDSDNNGSLDSTAFISAIDSTAKTVTLQSSTGASPTAMAVGDYDWKLYRAYTSLSAWESGTENTGIGVTYDSGDRDIASNSEQWNVACYANSGTAPDTTAVTISGWTTAQQNYIKVYTPTLSSEVTASQRHQGKWDSNKYRLENTSYEISISGNYVKIDGLQIKNTVTLGTAESSIYFNSLSANDNKIDISNNILFGVYSVATNGDGIRSIFANNNLYIFNNVIYGFNQASMSGIHSYSKTYIYNNTIYDSYQGIFIESGGSGIAKNNLVVGTTDPYRGSSYFVGSDYNATDKNDTDDGGIHSKISQTFSFIDSTNFDFHLSPTDTSAKDAGADLSKDLYLPITSDIDSQTRISNFSAQGGQIPYSQYDIGADEGATAIYRSLAPSATSAIASGTSPANSMIIAGTSVTFGTAPGDTVGVGDAIQYDSDNNGSIDSVAFITYRTDSTHYTIQDRTGGTPTSTSATDYDWSIFRAYTSLQNASGSTSGGTENTGLSNNIEHFDIDWSATHGKNIYTYNQQWNVAAYANSTTADSTSTKISAWTTYPTNYLKVYTPYATTEVGTSQRHQGKWDTGKYYRTITAGSSSISNYASFLRVEGIQIQITATVDSYTNGIYLYSASGSESEFQISNNIIKGVLSDSADHIYGIRTSSTETNRTKILKIWNNLVYDFVNGASSGIEALQIYSTGYSVYLYNNTVYNSYYGFRRYGGTVYAKNNIAQNCTDGYYGTFDASSDYNISNVAGDTTGISASYRNGLATTVSFSDSANKDFHLASNDTSARNSGADLSADSYLPITTDIDGHTRPTGTPPAGGWDIGADEGATGIYYSVGQSTSTDFKVASNVTVSGYTATFTTAQTGNIGVGDIVTYTGGSCYITGKTSTSIWSCQNATGGTAPQVSGVSVTSIKRAFASLNSSISGSTAPEFLNTSDLKTNNYILNIPCYMDSGTTPDTTAVTISGYTTAVPNYIKVYTPNNTTTEANQSQRHQGKWDDGKYNIGVTNSNVLDIYTPNIKIEGIQIKLTNTSGSSYRGAIIFRSGSGGDSVISNNLIVGDLSGGSSNYYGIKGEIVSAGALKIYNNIFYKFDLSGVEIETRTGTWYIYNNTFANSILGINALGNGWVTAKNNLFYSCTTVASGSYFATGTDYNATNNASMGYSVSGNDHDRISQTFTFQDSTNYDFHLGIGDTAARNQGMNLGSGSTEPYFRFDTDIDGNQRSQTTSVSSPDPRTWDIGADEAATAIYYSVGQSSSDLKTGSPTLSIDSSGNGTLSVSQTGNMGVGDYIEYGTSPYAKAYITGKTSSTVWTVQSATGTMLGVATTEPINSIKHSYTSLNGAIAGASGSTMMNTTDLYTNNLQLNVPCYMDSGTADTTAVTISGYTTYPTNYIKAYTPTSTTTEANNSQRHSGKWDDGKYNLAFTDPYGYGVTIDVGHFVFDGMQVYRERNDGPYGGYGSVYIGNSALPYDSKVDISNSIIKTKSTGTTGWNFGIYAEWGAEKTTLRAWNNVIYNLGSNGVGFGIFIYSGNNGYLYNNTIMNFYKGIYSNTYPRYPVVENNIVQNCQDGYDGSFTSSDYNISDLASDTTGGAHDKQATVNFVDSANYDFHLSESDSAARNAGADLSTDTNLAVTTDIDGNSRPTQNAFDIGADEGSTYIYYSVGQNTDDHKTGSPTITLSGYSATLDVAQTAPNMGVGDLITYTGGSCYITAKTSDDKMHWNCQNATGGTAPQVTGVSVTSIAHAFSSLGGSSDLVALSSNSGQGARNSSHLNTADLYAGNYILNIPCYYDTGADTTTVNISGWTTMANNYIKVYTPNNISTEVNQSQRHQGKWDNEKYNISPTAFTSSNEVIEENTKYVRIDGLQIKISTSGSVNGYGIHLGGLGINSDVQISNNIITVGTIEGTPNGIRGIATVGSRTNRAKIWNNILYGFDVDAGCGIMANVDSTYSVTWFIYNNTISAKTGIGAYEARAFFYAKNNIVQGATDGYVGSFASGSDYNISNVSADTTGGAHDKANTTVAFISSADKNYHLSLNDTAAKNAGIKLASYSDDSNLNFTTDIDGNSRTGDWSIGADDGPFVEAQQSKNIDTNESLNSGLVGYWSFDGDDMKGIGIGSTALDKSGNGNDGILSGTAPGPTAAIGKRGQGMSFDGSSGVITAGDIASSDTMTWSFWINPNDVSVTRRILDKYNTVSLGREWRIYVGSGVSCGYASLQISSDGNNNEDKSSNICLPKNTWTHVAFVFENGNYYAYQNGSSVSTAENFSLASIYNSNTPMKMGQGYVDAGLSGKLDEVRIYNRILSADEIGHLYRMGQVTIDKDLGNAVIKK